MKVDKNELNITKEKIIIGKSIGVLRRIISFLFRMTFKRQAIKMQRRSNSEGEKRGRLKSFGSWLIRGRVSIKIMMTYSRKKNAKRMIHMNPKEVKKFFEKMQK